MSQGPARPTPEPPRRKRQLTVALVGTLATSVCTLLAASCQTTPATRIELELNNPQGLLDGSDRLELRVISDGAGTCITEGPTAGAVDGNPNSSSIRVFPFENTGCNPGVEWCANIALEQDGAEHIFSMVAFDGSEQIAQGCTSAVIDGDLQIDIKIRPFNPPACCSDGVIQIGEQCDDGVQAATNCAGDPAPGANACWGVAQSDACECDCKAREIVLTVPSAGVSTEPATKYGLALTFGNASSSPPGELRAFYQDVLAPNDGNIIARYLDQHFAPQTASPRDGQFYLPRNCNYQNGARLGDQFGAAAAPLTNGGNAVAFLSNDLTSSDTGTGASATYNTLLTVVTPDGCTNDTDFQMNVGGTSNTAPAVAEGPDGKILVVWTASSQILGRIFDPMTLMKSPAGNLTLGLGVNGATARIVGTSDGWALTYRSNELSDIPNAIVLSVIDDTGTVESTKAVNGAGAAAVSLPDIARLPNGRMMVTWVADTDIMGQRFDVAGAAVPGDQDSPLSVGSPDINFAEGQRLAASPITSNGFFAAIWVTVNGEAWGRLVDGTVGFRRNTIDGQDGVFRFSHPAVLGKRFQPNIAIGGGGYIAVGWSDWISAPEQMVLRRFPLPAP